MEKHLITSKTLVLLDAGHGIDTPGKRSPVWADGTQLFEWAYNRVIVKYIKDYLRVLNVSFIDLVTENEDVPLSKRVERANKAYQDYRKDYELVYLVSIHGNAANSSRAKGIEVFTSVGQTMADPIAEIFYRELKKIGWRMRPGLEDGDSDKEEHFYILRKTKVPAILTENGFYTNEEECKKMLTFEWNMEIAKAHYRAIFEIEKLYIRGGTL